MQNINRDIETKNFKKMYLLYGTEAYLRNQFLNKLKAALDPDNDTMNCSVFQGKNINIEELIDLAETLPFLADLRVIFIIDSGLFKESAERLADYLSSSCDSTVFVFNETEVDKRSKMYKAVSSNGYACEFAEQKPENVKKWIMMKLKRENKQISSSTLDLFMSKTGNDLYNVDSELEKLFSYTYGKDSILKEDVETICVPVIEDKIFELMDAVSEQRKEDAIAMYLDLVALHVPSMKVITLLGKQANRLLWVKSLKKAGYTGQMIASEVGFPPFFANKYIKQASIYKTSVLKKILEASVTADEDVKTGALDETMSCELLIMRMLESQSEKI